MTLRVIFSKSANVWVQSILDRRPDQIRKYQFLDFHSNSQESSLIEHITSKSLSYWQIFLLSFPYHTLSVSPCRARFPLDLSYSLKRKEQPGMLPSRQPGGPADSRLLMITVTNQTAWDSCGCLNNSVRTTECLSKAQMGNALCTQLMWGISTVRLPGFGSQFYFLLAAWSWI